MFSFCNTKNEEKEEEEELVDKNEDLEDTLNRRDKKTSNAQTAWSILNLIQGMGVLGIPYAISIGGYLVIANIIFVGFLLNYTSKALIACQYDENTKSKRRCGYAALGGIVWSNYGSKVVSGTQFFHLFGACVLYQLLVEDFIEQCFLDSLGSRLACNIVSGFILIPTVFIGNMKQISWLNFVSVLIIDVVFATLIVLAFVNIRLWRFDDLHVFDAYGFSIANSIVLFSFVAHPYLPKVEEEMKNKSKFGLVSNVSFTLATLIKIIFGMVLALFYGLTTKQKIADNIKDVTTKQAVSCMLALVGYLSFAMPSEVLIKIIQKAEVPFFEQVFSSIRQAKHLSTWTWWDKCIDVSMKSVLLVCAVAFGSLISQFSLLMAVFGSCTATLLTIVYPVWFLYSLHPSINKGFVVIVICYGFLSGSIGFVTSIMKIAEKMENAQKH